MKPHRALIWLVLLGCCMGAIVTGNQGRYPSPYVDDWSDVDLRLGTVDATPAIVACFAATGNAFLREGIYALDPQDQVVIPAGGVLRGAGMGNTTVRLESGRTGIGFRMTSGATIADLTIDGNDEASTTGVAPVSGGSTVGLACRRVRFQDLDVGASDNGVVTGWLFAACEWTSNVTVNFTTSTTSANLTFLGGRQSGATTGIALGNVPTGVLIEGMDFDGQTTGVNLSSSVAAAVHNCRFNSTTSISWSTPIRAEISGNYYAADEIVLSDVTNQQILLRGKYWGTASPSAGTWLTGDVVHNSTPGTVPLTATHWVCGVGGTSGTWRAAYSAVSMIGASATWDPGALNNGESVSTSVTITGGTVGDTCIVTHGQNLPNGLILFGQVISATEVEVSLCNIGGGAAQDVASGTLYVRVLGQ